MMYGTIFRLQPQPGREQDVVALTEEWTRNRGPQADGAHAVYLLRSERRPGELIGVATFADRSTYEANASTPEQDAWYRRLRELLEVDPVWEDGELPVAAHFSNGAGA